MKTTSVFVLLFMLLISFTFTYSQNEIKNYEPPEVIEGSNLIINARPAYYHKSDNYSTLNNFNINFNPAYTGWRFTRKFDYSFNLRPYLDISKTKEKFFDSDTTFDRSSALVLLTAATDYYLYKNLAYTGLYSYNEFGFMNREKPIIANQLSVFIGAGKIVDAKMVIAADNFEDVLISEGIIKSKLSPQIKKKLIQLLDKRNNREFISKFKDDNEIEFFAQVESFLIDNGVLTSPLGSKSVLKLFQALTNKKFLYFPFYKGLQLQISGNFLYFNDRSSINNLYSVSGDISGRVKKDLSISGLWGLPFSKKTELISSLFFSFPIDTFVYRRPLQTELLSPITIKEENTIYSYYNNPTNIFNIYSANNSYIAGAKTYVFHYLSKTIGITGELNYLFAKARKNKDDQYSLSARAYLAYNIINSLTLSAGLDFFRFKHSQYLNFITNFSYYIF